MNEVASVPSEPTSSVSIIMRAGNGNETNGIKDQSMRPSTHQSVLKGFYNLNSQIIRLIIFLNVF